MARKTNNTGINSDYLEPRVAKLETGLDRLAEDVKDLAGIVRAQGTAVESEIQKLVVAVTQAQAPKRTDWGTIISAVFLVLAIGSAVFWPLNQSVENNKIMIKEVHDSLAEHVKGDTDPTTGWHTRLGYVEHQIKSMEEKFTDVAGDNKQAITEVDRKITRENELIANEIKAQVSNLSSKYDREIQNLGDRLISRVNEYEKDQHDEMVKDLDELRMWRLRAMNANKEVPPPPVSPK